MGPEGEKKGEMDVNSIKHLEHLARQQKKA